MFLLAFAALLPRLRMPNVEFWSVDRTFGLHIPEEKITLLLEKCRQSKPDETGGILIGFYTSAHDCAVVTTISKAPPDSQSGRAYFVRGLRGLQRLVDSLWHRKHYYYLGEWHFHPNGPAIPSSIDSRQMKKIANAAGYQCPEPILVIIGGNPPEEWAVKAYVYPRGKNLIELTQS
jgi:integrative and conjugative element protein (TIGR02256 family)